MLKAAAVTDVVITDHARFQMKRRGVTEEMVQIVLNSPSQQLKV